MNSKLIDLSGDAKIICVCKSCKKQFFTTLPRQLVTAGMTTVLQCPFCSEPVMFQYLHVKGGDLN